MRQADAERRLDALARFDRVWIESLKREVQHAKWETGCLLRAVLTGGEFAILGQPVRFEVTWPDGAPYGMTNEQIADHASAIYPRELPGASQ